MSRPVVSSMRSKHTGQVGSSTSAGVGGAIGLTVNDGAAGDSADTAVTLAVFGCAEGRNGSSDMLGKLDGFSA